MKRKITNFLLILIFIISCVIIFDKSMNNKVNAATAPITISVVTETVVPDGGPLDHGVESDTFAPGDSFKALFYAKWDKGTLVNGAQLDIKLNSKFGSNLEELEASDVHMRYNNNNIGYTPGQPIVIPDGRDEQGSDYDSRLNYYTLVDMATFSSVPTFFSMLGGLVDGSANGANRDVRDLGGTSQTSSAFDGVPLMSTEKGVLLGMVEYTLTKNASGTIDFVKELDGTVIMALNGGINGGNPISTSDYVVEEHIVNIDAPSNNTLKNLEVSTTGSAISNTATLTPKFTSEGTAYTVDIPSDATHLNVKPTFDSSLGMTVTVNGSQATSGVNSVIDTSTINDGDVIKVVVTPPDGGAATTYNITVNKLSTDASIKTVVAKAYEDNTYKRDVTVNPSGSNYESEEYKYAETGTGLIITTSDPSAKMTINGTAVASGSEYKGVTFSGNETSKTVTVVVTAEAGNSKSYTIKLNRAAADSNTNVGSIDFTGQHDFGSGVKTYTPTISGDKYTIGTVGDPVLFLEKKITVRVKLESDTSYITYDGNKLVPDASGYYTFVLDLAGTNALYKFEFTVTPQSGTGNDRTYNIEVNREVPDTDTSLTYQGYGGATGDLFTPKLSGTTNITYTLPSEEGVLKLVLSGLTDKTVYVSDNQNNFTDKYNGNSYNINVGDTAYVKVVAQDGTHSTIYTFIVNAAPVYSKDNTLYGLGITANSASGDLSLTVGFSQNKYDGYVFNVDYKYTDATFTVTIDEKATYQITGGAVSTYATKNDTNKQPLAVGTNEFKIRVTSEAGTPSEHEYTIIINRSDASTENYLESFIADGVDANVNRTDRTYDIVLPRGRDNISISHTVSSGATAFVTPNQTSNIKLNNGKVTIYVTVKSEAELVDGGSGRNYTFNIYSASQQKGVTSVELLENEGGVALPGVDGKYLAFDEDTTEYEITVPYVNSTVYLDVEKFDQYATLVTLKGSVGTISLTPGVAKTIQFMVRSEYGQLKGSDDGTTTKVYTVTITRALGSDEAYLNDLQFIVNGENKLLNFEGGLNPSTYDYVISEKLAGDVTSVDIEYVPGKGTVSGDFGKNKPIQNAGTFSIYVTSESGKKVIYTITYTRDGYNPSTDSSVLGISAVDSDNKEYITSFNPAQTDYSVVLPYDKNSVTITVTLPDGSRATVSIDNTVQSNKYAQITGITESERVVPIVVRSEDGSSTATYNVKVRKEAASSEKDLLAIMVGEKRFDNPLPEQANKIQVFVPFGTTSIDVDAILPDGSTAQIVSGAPYTIENLSLGTTSHTIVVQAQDKSINTYYIEIIRDTEDFVFDIEVYDNTNKENIALSPEFVADTNTYTATAKYNTANVNFKINMPNNPGLTYTISPAAQSGVYVLTSDVNEFVITFTSVSGVSKEYIVTINKPAKNTNAYLDTLVVSSEDKSTQYEFDQPFVKETTNYTLRVDRNTDRVYLDATAFETTNIKSLVINGNSSTINAGVISQIVGLKVGKNVIQINVSRDGTDRAYTLTIYCASDEAKITNIELKNMDDTPLEGGFTFEEGTYDYGIINVPYATSSIKLLVEALNEFAVIYVNNVLYNSSNQTQLLTVGETTFEIYAKSEYSQLRNDGVGTVTPSYTFIINRAEQSADATLRELRVDLLENPVKTILDVDNSLNPINETHQLVVETTTATQVQIHAVPNDPYATVVGATIADISRLPDGQTRFMFEVVVTAQNGAKKSYIIYLTREELNLDGDTSIANIEVYDERNTQYLINDQQFEVSRVDYEITIPYGPKTYTISASYTLVDGKYVLIDNNNTTNGSKTFQVPANYASQQHTVQVVAADGTKGTIYNIKVNFVKPSTDTTIDLRVDGATVPGFNVDVFSYTINRNTDVTSVSISAYASDPNATITGHIGTFQLNYGPNTFAVTITAQDGVTSKTYTITVNRAYPNPTLDDLYVVNEKFHDKNGNIIDYAKNILEYYVNVQYNKTTAEIVYIKSDATDTVVGAGEVNLEVGLNVFEVRVTSINNVTTTYVIYIERLPEASSDATIKDLEATLKPNDSLFPELGEDFAADKSNKEFGIYTVDNSVYRMDFNIILSQQEGPNAASVKVYSAGEQNDGTNEEQKMYANLEVGLNYVIIVVTAADQVTTNVTIVKVDRKPMAIQLEEVDGVKLTQNTEKNGTTYENNILTPENVEYKEYYYDLDLGNNSVKDFDFTKLVKSLDETKSDYINIEVLSDLSDDADEVVISVTDGDQTRVIHFSLPSNSWFNIGNSFTLILGIIAIILLIAILISVNRQKYGRISNKRKSKRA